MDFGEGVSEFLATVVLTILGGTPEGRLSNPKRCPFFSLRPTGVESVYDTQGGWRSRPVVGSVLILPVKTSPLSEGRIPDRVSSCAPPFDRKDDSQSWEGRTHDPRD